MTASITSSSSSIPSAPSAAPEPQECGPHTSAKLSAAALAELLPAHGVDTVFASPGSRNSPLLIALARSRSIRLHMVVDERSAAFMALGYAAVAGAPAALVCTSGTALLNYLPAVAEAHYRATPLIVISADRPEAWIDQNDSQTLPQRGALEPFVKCSVDLPDVAADAPAPEDASWLTNRELNAAILTALAPRRGPVHINLRYCAPLARTLPQEKLPAQRVVQEVHPDMLLSTPRAREMGRCAAMTPSVLVALGIMEPDRRISKAVGRLAAHANVAVLAEPLANVHAPGIITDLEGLLAPLSPHKRASLRPDLLITAGGAPVSAALKEWLRACPPREHWHVSLAPGLTDTFRALTRAVKMPPELFLPQLASGMHIFCSDSPYAATFRALAAESAARRAAVIRSAPWCSLKAMAAIVDRIPSRWNVQAGNGTTIRLLHHLDCSRLHRLDCNRGVSGIDGSTSTAIGASIAAPHAPTLLISGDMSMLYDLTALGTAQVDARLKVVVMDNGGGGIFRSISGLASLPELEGCFVVNRRTPFAPLARAWGWEVWEADSETSLRKAWTPFAEITTAPAMLIVHTDGPTDALALKQLLTIS